MNESNEDQIGENVTTLESLAYFLLSCAFLMFYLGSIGLNLNLYIFLSVFLAAVCLKFAWERAARNREKNLKNGPGYSERIIKWIMRKIGMTIYPAEWGVKINGQKWEIRYIGVKIYQILLLMGLVLTFQQDNLRPMLLFSMWGSMVYIVCRVLAGIPRPALRMVVRGVLGIIVAAIVVIPTMAIMPYYVNVYAEIPENKIGTSESQGWVLSEYENIEMGMGLVQISFAFYFDEEGEEDGYVAFLTVVSAKIPEGASDDLVEMVDEEMRMAIQNESEMELTENITNQSRSTKQEYNTTYSIYDGVSDGEEVEQGGLSYPITEGSELRYIIESIRVEELNLLVILSGLAVISKEQVNTGPGPIGDVIDDILGTDTTDMTNWNEVLNLGTEVVCYQG